MANLNLVTGFAGTPHVTAEDAGVLNAVILGPGQYVMNYGNKLQASVITNNQVRVLDGVIMMQGRQIRIEEDISVDLAIENGATGYYRNDLIVARYTKDASTGVEEANLVVIKGTATTGEAADPTYTSGNIFAGAVQNDMPLYRIPINGINVQDPIPLFQTVGNVTESLGNIDDHIKNKNNPHGVTLKHLGGAEAEHTHQPSDIDGVVPITKGGTGTSTAEAARTALGITPGNIGASPSGHTHAYSEITGAPVFSYNSSTKTLTITKG